ncbi:lipoprotein [Microtetraspora sp. NBRC 13810]|uniref:DUF4232 domain-containing protein n=1 Tax=Microtetraspora sp. NBRC 13810 TaxID=3030990 RepID=UPI0024A4236E|nr:DUF4232 domain-containing protein [Microtetraspora sp. NBRC 13810]GLW08063.1 lipoprotein [Microtetraspora sp. NBRC 13810]
MADRRVTPAREGRAAAQGGRVPLRHGAARPAAPARGGLALLAYGAALLTLLTACSGAPATTSPPATAPASDPAATSDPASAPDPASDGSIAGGAQEGGSTRSSGYTGSKGSGARPAPTATVTPAGRRCHTPELALSIGPNDPGAGQRNYPIVLTNTSSRTCTVYGYPGTGFVDAAGRSLTPDPERVPGRPRTVTLEPGDTAWAGLSFTNPDISEARAVTPETLLVTPPDETTQLTTPWTGGQVPAVRSSRIRLTPFQPGEGP